MRIEIIIQVAQKTKIKIQKWIETFGFQLILRQIWTELGLNHWSQHCIWLITHSNSKYLNSQQNDTDFIHQNLT